MNDANVLTETDLPLPLFIRGKVRDTYDLGNHLGIPLVWCPTTWWK